ncbi:hypothetical protein MEX01_28830 [Methylorubrum extorquens]|uniref:hypothetical protein n=1 Tax=Methylorubrum extorquens TaxID=408 RepID=UPI001173B2D4|nr:hypothetical protein [Methylorubrum extorquens]GEL42292.1 hypothetical protein MEX01_28830 [Methylorubrum extorquens]
MSGNERYGAMTFVRDRFGQLREGRVYPCTDGEVARKVAEDRVLQGWAPGAAAFLRRGGGEFDEGETITLAAFGDVPAGVREQMPF